MESIYQKEVPSAMLAAITYQSAIAAPTPVSALVHSSTLVTAGVYILIRYGGALEVSCIRRFLIIVSCLTIFIVGLGANFEFNLKKIIALSTLRLLGVIISILSLGFTDLAFFHLLTHALFKALLFMCAGMVIHRVKEYQDIRNIGRLVICIPLTRVCMNLPILALCGMPFLAGFYSNDLILEVAFIREINIFRFLLYVLGAGLTVCYTFRLIYYRLRCFPNIRSMIFVRERHRMILRGIVALRIVAVRGGCVLAWVVLPEPYMICLKVLLKVLALLVKGIGALLCYVRARSRLKSVGFYSYIVFIGSI
ncbi:NADH-ubiquinone oxidoreductase chain 5-like [Cherax quadricarinatus]|uniref:NADH-ubiquinone oxidoreductase chain 5-like n=1 Tax=Cherax quadricarinatus TaxID=27406 RepID=UPI00387E345F